MTTTPSPAALRPAASSAALGYNYIVAAALLWATIGPAAVRDAYRVVYVSREATVGRFAVDGLRAQVTYSCIRAHADVVVVRNIHCAMTGGPQSGRVNMPFGLNITAAKTVSIEDSSFEGF